MKKLTNIGCVQADENNISILSKIVLNENSTVNLTELSGFEKIVVVCGATELEKQIFAANGSDGSDIISLNPVKLISVDKNIVTVEGLFHMRVTSPPICDIKPYYPEYDLQIGEETPEWTESLLKEYK